MTDSCRIPSLYYSAENYNNGITNINASDDKQLVVPLIENGDSQNWQVAIAKLRAPLGTIPLTQANIGLKKYQIILRNGQYEGSAFVRQLNATSGNLCYSLTGTVLSKYSYTSTVITLVSTQNLSTVCLYPNNVFWDDFLNVYISGSNTNPTPNVLASLPFTNIKSIYIDRNQKVYVSDDTVVGTLVTVYNNNNGVNQVQLSVLGVISTDFAGDILNNSIFVVATDNTIIVGHNTTTISYYTSLLAPITDYQITNGHQLTAANVLNSDGTLLVVDSSQLADSLFGTQASEVWNVETNTQQTVGTIISHAAITTTGYAFVVGSIDNFT